MIFGGGLYPLLLKGKTETIQFIIIISASLPDSFSLVITFNSEYDFMGTKSSQFIDLEKI